MLAAGVPLEYLQLPADDSQAAFIDEQRRDFLSYVDISRMEHRRKRARLSSGIANGSASGSRQRQSSPVVHSKAPPAEESCECQQPPAVHSKSPAVVALCP